MAFEYLVLNHVLNENGEKILVNELEWADKRLSADARTEFKTKWAESVAQLENDIADGKVLLTQIYESAVGQNGDTTLVNIGYKLTFLNVTDKYQFHPGFQACYDIVKQDTSLTFNDPVWIDCTI